MFNRNHAIRMLLVVWWLSLLNPASAWQKEQAHTTRQAFHATTHGGRAAWAKSISEDVRFLSRPRRQWEFEWAESSP